MKTIIARLSLALIAITGLHAQDEDPNQANLDLLAANAASFVEAYNKGDAAALANLFLPSGEIVLANGEVVAGREEISRFYSEILTADNRPQAALEAGSVRFVTPGIAVEDGTLHVTLPSGEVISHYYTAVQVKQEDGGWLTASIRDEIEDHAPASEKLLALEWMVGDWLIEKDGTRTFLSFSWSEDGPFIDGKALTEIAGSQSTSSTYRIGWNSNRDNFVSWAFDATGGYTKSEWTTAANGWLLRTVGVTSDGEINQSTQSLSPGTSAQSYIWATRDQTIGDEMMPERTVTVVKRPPSPAALSTTTEE
jgi:uncharacterized protein (TIGR02246 family)